MQFALRELTDGKSRWDREVTGFRESVTLRRLRTDSALDHEFEFTDTDSPRQGDYYYVRVKQLDGGMAWSSPIWVGGISVRYDL